LLEQLVVRRSSGGADVQKMLNVFKGSFAAKQSAVKLKTFIRGCYFLLIFIFKAKIILYKSESSLFFE